jgi:hypothetical protein
MGVNKERRFFWGGSRRRMDDTVAKPPSPLSVTSHCAGKSQLLIMSQRSNRRCVSYERPVFMETFVSQMHTVAGIALLISSVSIYKIIVFYHR